MESSLIFPEIHHMNFKDNVPEVHNREISSNGNLLSFR